jgi:RHS repeat-associated protein
MNLSLAISKRSGDCATGTILESWSFLYDGDGIRVGTVHFTGASGTPDSTTSYYMGGQYEIKDGTVKKYYSIAGMMVAVNDGTGLQYLLTDHLGSTVAVTNSSGTLTSQQRYLPFGGTRAIPNSPILGTDFGYTGQRLLDSGMGGIMDYKARFYSVGLGRFQQPDTVIPDPSNPQNWNRYSYGVNNPIRYNDPDGHCAPLCALPMFGLASIVQGIVAAGAAVVTFVTSPVVLTVLAVAVIVVAGVLIYERWQQNRVDKQAIKNAQAFNQFVSDTQSSDKIPNYDCRKTTYCIPEILAGLGILLAAVTHGGCNEPESLTRCPSPTTLPTPTSTSTPTATPIPTSTSTLTPTSTSTSTLTSTPTQTPTQTPTISPPSTTPRIVPYPRRINALVEMQ